MVWIRFHSRAPIFVVAQSQPKHVGMSMRKGLKGYQKVAKTRNEAIIEYNASVQLLFENISLERSLKTQEEDLGHQAIAIDANLPSVVHWLRNACGNLRLNIMQDLNDQSRAIRYWGLHENPPSTDAMPLQNEVFLSNERQTLRQVFRKCLERYAASVRSIWPGDDRQQGIFYKLSAEERNRLKTSKTVSDHVEYSALIRLDPYTSHHIFRNNVDIRLRQVDINTPSHASCRFHGQQRHSRL